MNPEESHEKAAEDYGPSSEAGSCQSHPQAVGPDSSVIPAELLARLDVLDALAARDIGALYRILNDAGVTQRRIAALTGTSQPQVADIITGQRVRVQGYDVLERIALGLGIPREWMGLSWWGPDGVWYGPGDAYPECGRDRTTSREVDDGMLRRHLIALAGVMLTGAPVPQVGHLLEDLGVAPETVMPARLDWVHVAQTRDLTAGMLASLNTVGTPPEIGSAVITAAERLLEVSGPDPVRRALLTALAELHLHAGWSAFDAGLYKRGMRHYARAFELATKSGDAYCRTLALTLAGLATVEQGHPNDGLKMLQAGQIGARTIPADLGRPVGIGEGSARGLGSRALADSATALAAMGDLGNARRRMAESRDLWTPTRADRAGSHDYIAARLELGAGRLDVARELASASIRRWEGVSERARANSSTVLATIYVRAAEPQGLALARESVSGAARLGAPVRLRRLLTPLAVALESRPGPDARELARMARQVAA